MSPLETTLASSDPLISESRAAFALDMKPDTVPAAVLGRAKSHVLDTLGIAFAYISRRSISSPVTNLCRPPK